MLGSTLEDCDKQKDVKMAARARALGSYGSKLVEFYNFTALQVRVQDHRRLAESRGYSKLPDLSRRGSPMAPIASFDEQGRIEWNEEFCEKIEQLCKEK